MNLRKQGKNVFWNLRLLHRPFKFYICVNWHQKSRWIFVQKQKYFVLSTIGSFFLSCATASQATTNLRTVSDTVGSFLATECAFEPGVKMSRSALRETLMKWCEEEGINRVPTARKLATALTERGVADGGKTMSDRSGPASVSRLMQSGVTLRRHSLHSNHSWRSET